MAKRFPRQDTLLQRKLRIVARQMRHEPTPAEDFLWQHLRSNRLSGYKFHRQYRIDRFITDFYCSHAALVIEVDGDVHRQQVEADQERERALTALGFYIIRFTNTEVLKDIERVICQISKTLEGTPSPKLSFDNFGEGAGDEDG